MKEINLGSIKNDVGIDGTLIIYDMAKGIKRPGAEMKDDDTFYIEQSIECSKYVFKRDVIVMSQSLETLKEGSFIVDTTGILKNKNSWIQTEKESKKVNIFSRIISCIKGK